MTFNGPFQPKLSSDFAPFIPVPNSFAKVKPLTENAQFSSHSPGGGCVAITACAHPTCSFKTHFGTWRTHLQGHPACLPPACTTAPFLLCTPEKWVSEVSKHLCHLFPRSAPGNGGSVKGKSFIWCSGGISSTGELKPRASRDKYHLYDPLLSDFFSQHFMLCASADAAGDGTLSGFVKSTGCPLLCPLL